MAGQNTKCLNSCPDCDCSRIDIIGQNGNDGEIYHHLHKHGHRPKSGSSPTYITWSAMKKRCNDKNNKNYAGNGITYDKRWEDFVNFLVDMGERPKGMTLDRINPEKGYYKDNCRWATSEQQVDNRRNTKKVMFKGELKYFVDIGKEYGISTTTIYRRWKQGYRENDLIDKTNKNRGKNGRML